MPKPPVSAADTIRAKDSSKAARELVAKEAAIFRQWKKEAEKHFLIFARGLRIKAQVGPRRLDAVIADFQMETFEALAPNLEAVRERQMPANRRFWIERTKKASKDGDLAIIVTWLIAFPREPLYGQIGAADRDQAGIVRDRVSDLLFYNEWLNEHMELVGNEIRSKKLRPDGKPLAKFDIRSSDVAGAHGGTPDVLIINELSHITKFEFAENMMDNADGVAQGIQIIATNAGYKGTKAWTWRKAFTKSPLWKLFVLDRPAPWHGEDNIAEARRRNTRSRFLRLWKGIWVTGGGDAFDEEAIEDAFCRQGPLAGPEKGWQYVAGLDLGVSRDHAGLVVVGVSDQLKKIRLAAMRRWDPKTFEGGKVDLRVVRKDVIHLMKQFRVTRLIYDPHQAVLLAQDCKAVVRTVEMAFTPKNLNDMANSMKQLVEQRRWELYDTDNGQLRGDFAKFSIVEKSYGYRLEATKDEDGHADVGTALAMTAPYSMQLAGILDDTAADRVLYDEAGEDDLSPEEVDELPEEFQELFAEESAAGGSGSWVEDFIESHHWSE
jgi:hypothetical protein